MGKVATAASSVLFLVALASAEVPSGNAFFGYSYYNSANLSSPLFGRATTNGWEASIEGKILPFVGLPIRRRERLDLWSGLRPF